MTHWIVDGMNVIGSRPTGWWRDRPRAMRELVNELTTFADATGEPVTVVFDGAPFELEGEPSERAGRARASEGGQRVEVLFATRPGPGAADDDIAALVAGSADSSALCVVTSDRGLEQRVRERGTEVMGAGAFRGRLDELLGMG